MPKVVDHAQRRDEIALVACRVVAQHGFDGASMVRIAHEAGYTTGMLAHYFDTKQDIIIAALRLILRRIEELVTFINGLTASAVANRGDWPPELQVEQLRLQLQLLRAWATGTASAPLAQQAAGA